MTDPAGEPLTPVKRALVEVRDLRARLEVSERRLTEPVAVVGLALRFPGGASDGDSYWQLLHEGRDAVSEVPLDRWDAEAYYDPNPGVPGKMYTRHGAFLERVDLFDAHVFGISPREAALMDPQQRILLEVTWEALEHAGLAPDRLRDSPTGVFVGMGGSDYGRLVFSDGSGADIYAATGTALSVAAGRISYALGLHGPSLAVDTACSASLVAVHLAVQSLRSGECSLALAGGVSLMLLPDVHVSFCQARMLAPDGRCKTFDAAADGYVRGEGCGVLVLKRLGDAIADGDRVMAVIRGSAVNQDGRSNGLTAPNGPAQEAVIRAALGNAGVEASQIDYVETHGTGTSLGDPIEVRALGAVFGPGRERARPLRIGSVKTNIGHLEAAAGLAGFIKVVLALQHGEIPPHLHLSRANHHVDWASLPIEVPTAPSAWPKGERRRMAGVSSFGFSGTNAHVILEEAPRTDPMRVAAAEHAATLLTLSAQSEAVLRASAGRLAAHLGTTTDPTLPDVAFTLDVGRARLSHRLALVTGSRAEAKSTLADFAEGRHAPNVFSGVAPARSPEVAFLFTGQGAQYLGMGRELYQSQESFRATLDRCDALLRPMLDTPLLSVMFGAADARPALLDQTVYTQPALFALEFALAELLRSWGIEPSAVIGHSLGEYVAACVAGVLSLEDGISLVAERARLMHSLPGGGAMAAVNLSETRVADVLARGAGRLWIAAVNGPESVVISGEAGTVEKALQELTGQGVRVQPLRISNAFHSPLVEPILDALERKAASLEHRAPRVELISNLTGGPVGPGLAWPAHWRRHAREAVRFSDGIRTLEKEGFRVFVEIGPNPTLLSQGQECSSVPDAAWIPTLRKGRPEWTSLLECLGTLFVRGVASERGAVDRGRGRCRVALPTYPFDRSAFWVARASAKTPAEPLWEVVLRAARFQSGQGPLELNIATFARKWECLERLTTEYQVQALSSLGLFTRAGERWSPAEAVERGGVLGVYDRLLARWFEKLAGEGLLRREGESFFAPAPLATARIGPVMTEAEHAFGDYPELLAYVRGCGERLPAVLTGRESALETLFPGGSFDIADGIYQHSAVARYLNGIARAGIEGVVLARPTGTLRVLEIGGGTGGTTSAVLPVLPAERSSYTFTDVSDLFLGRAASRLAAFPFVRFAIFDVEKEPREQGFSEGSFDVVVAANVLHATRDLRATLTRVRSLLAPGGLLLLSETTSHSHYFDISTGLIEGWQRFDDDVRRDNPLVSAGTWVTLLHEAGFEAAAAFPEDGRPTSILGNHVILAATPGRPDSLAAAGATVETAPAEATSARLVDGSDEAVLEELRQATPSERHGILAQCIRRQVMNVLRLDAAHPPDLDRGLIDLGLDSLMAVQLKNELGRRLGLEGRLPSTLVFDHPTCSHMAAYLERSLFGPTSPVLAVATMEPAAPGTRETIEQLSEAEAEAMLLKRLQSLDGEKRR